MSRFGCIYSPLEAAVSLQWTTPYRYGKRCDHNCWRWSSLQSAYEGSAKGHKLWGRWKKSTLIHVFGALKRFGLGWKRRVWEKGNRQTEVFRLYFWRSYIWKYTPAYKLWYPYIKRKVYLGIVAAAVHSQGLLFIVCQYLSVFLCLKSARSDWCNICIFFYNWKQILEFSYDGAWIIRAYFGWSK